MATPTQYVFLAAASTLVLLAFANAVRSYRRLSHISGPPFAAVSRLCMLKSFVGDRNHLNFYEVSLKYGALARIGPNQLITSDPDLMRRMSAPRAPYRRARWHETFRFKVGMDNLFSERDERKHEDMKKKLAAGYAGKDNPRFEAEIDERIQDLMNLIERKYVCTKEEPGRQMDFGEKAQFLTLDVISGLAFGQPFGDLVDDKDQFDYVKSVEGSLPLLVCLSGLPEVHSFLEKSSLMKLLAPSAGDKIGLGKVLGTAKEKVSERFGDDRKVVEDMLGSFLKHGVTQEEAESETVLQLIAGTDTTATAIRAIILFAITTPRVLWRLRAEIDEAAKNGRISSPIRDSEARRMPYLQACIKEGLRVFPPAAGLFPKTVPPEGDTLNGVFIPGGTEIGHSAWAIHRSTAVFGADSNVFRPERWLDVPEAQLQIMERNNELIFGYGRFKCVGQAVALMELNKIFVELLRVYDVAIVDPSNPWSSVNAGVFFQKNMWVRITRRGGEVE